MTYAAVVLLILIGVTVHRGWADRCGRMAAASPDDKPSPDLIAAINDPMARAAGPVSGLLWILILAMMVFRP